MAKKPVAVTEEEFKKDPENVQRIETPIPGFADAEPLVTYIKVEYLDDLTGKTAPEGDIESVAFLMPVQEEREVVELDDQGSPVKNTDGSDKLTVQTFWDVEPREIDLSSASLKKLVTALRPFYEKSRPRVIQAPARVAAAKSASTGVHDTAAIREWAKTAGHDVNPKGRIPGKIITAYYAATGKPNPEEQNA